MKKKLSLLLAALLVVSTVFTGCGSKKADADGLNWSVLYLYRLRTDVYRAGAGLL